MNFPAFFTSNTFFLQVLQVLTVSPLQWPVSTIPTPCYLAKLLLWRSLWYRFLWCTRKQNELTFVFAQRNVTILSEFNGILWRRISTIRLFHACVRGKKVDPHSTFFAVASRPYICSFHFTQVKPLKFTPVDGRKITRQRKSFKLIDQWSNWKMVTNL